MSKAGASLALSPALAPAPAPALASETTSTPTLTQPLLLLSDVPEEVRILRAIKAIQSGQSKTLAAAARDYAVPYYRLRSRAQGAQPKSNNCGNNLLTPIEELALHAWINFQLSIGLFTLLFLLYICSLLTERGNRKVNYRCSSCTSSYINNQVYRRHKARH